MKSNNTNNTNDVPADVRPYDILCGRSKTCFNNIGNRRFRITISMNLKKYDSLPNRTERSKFIFTLAQTLKEDAGFRFVRISKKNGRVELTDEEIRAKIGHALRDLSKAQAEANAAAAKPAEEAKKFMESTKEYPTLHKPIVTPQMPQRKVRNEDVATAEVHEIRKETVLLLVDSAPSSRNDTSFHAPSSSQQQQQPQKQEQVGTVPFVMDDDDISEMTQDMISLPQHEMLHPDREEENELHSSMKMPALMMTHPTEFTKSIPRMIHSCNHVEQDIKAVELGDDKYCLMPLRFDAGILEPASKSTFDIDEDDFQRRCSLV